MLRELFTAPFKVLNGALDGVAQAADNVINHEEKSEGEVTKTILSGGILDVIEGTFKGTKKAVEDIANSDK